MLTINNTAKGVLIMKLQFWLSALAVALLAASAPAMAAGSVQVCDPVNLNNCANVDSTGHVLTTGTSSPSGTQDVNVKNIGGNAVSTGTGASGVGTERVVTSTDSTVGVEGTDGSTQASPANPFPVTPGTGANFKTNFDQTTPGTTNGVVTNTGSTTAATQATASALNDTATQGAPNTAANAWPIKNTDGTNTAAVKAASTAPVATDPALVVGLSPNGNQATATNQPTNAAQGSTTSGQTGTPAVCATISTPPTNTTAQSNFLVCGLKGGLTVNQLYGTTISQISGLPIAPIDASGNNRIPGTANYLYDGTNTNVGIGCTSSATVSVTAGNTLQIVALVAAKAVRVCGFSLAMSAAGTAQFEYGTATNCGTGTTALTGAIPLATGTPWTMSMPEGQLFATASANELCVVAVTGNVVGFVSYAQF